jgi:hypothetical protein
LGDGATEDFFHAGGGIEHVDDFGCTEIIEIEDDGDVCG